jgi:hypothetical protein
MKVERSIPYFNALLKAPVVKRIQILQSFPAHVVDDLIEILYNVVLGRVDIGSRTKNLKRHRKALLDIVNTKGKRFRRNIIYRQKGGFLGALIPIVLSTVAGIIGKKAASK